MSAFTPITVGDLNWALVAEIDEDEVMVPINALIVSIVIAVLVFAFLVTLIAWLVSKGFTVPLKEIITLTEAVSAGSVSAEVDIRQRDEFGKY
ncbi:MAG: hypothetical protein GY866_39390 [Proteobacteria bacterium]|nr:hypothetical protein [Pseudomonadota bacterium]